MPDFKLSQEQYEALISFAQLGAQSAAYKEAGVAHDKALALEGLLKNIERANGVVRYSLWVQWQDPTAPLPPGTDFPKTWPPEMRHFIQFLSRPVSKDDVLQVVRRKTKNATNILVTPDVGALLGWTPLNQYFAHA